MFTQKRIVIDPGHGGEATGAIGNMSQEKNINLEVGKKLSDILLQDVRFIPLLTRDTDTDIHNSIRPEIAIRNNADMFISIHCNSFTSELPHDCQVYYYSHDKDMPLAEIIFKHIDKLDGITSKWSRVEYGNFIVLRKLNNTGIPGVLIEIGFISNEKDEKLLNDESFQDALAHGIYEAIREFFPE